MIRKTLIGKDGKTYEVEEEIKPVEFSKIDAITEILSIIKKDDACQFVDAKKLDDNTYHVPYYNYNNKIFEIMKIINPDLDCWENFKKIENKNIEDLTLREVETYLSRIFRGERFCEGIVARCIQDGTLEKLLWRYIKLC